MSVANLEGMGEIDQAGGGQAKPGGAAPPKPSQGKVGDDSEREGRRRGGMEEGRHPTN